MNSEHVQYQIFNMQLIGLSNYVWLCNFWQHFWQRIFQKYSKIVITLNDGNHEILEKTSMENDIQNDHSELEKQSRVTKSIKLV